MYFDFHRELIATRLESFLKLISITDDPVAYKGFEDANGFGSAQYFQRATSSTTNFRDSLVRLHNENVKKSRCIAND